MFLKILIASGALLVLGVLAMRSTGAGRENPSQGCRGMDMAESSSAVANARGGGCSMMAPRDTESHPMATKPTSRRAVNKTTYTCPMHPNIVRTEPGKCPLCGMRLVLKQEQPNNDKKTTEKSDSGPSQSDHGHNH